MSTTAHSLPAGFEALEPFVAGWAISGTANRARRRDESTAEERVAFFDAAKGLAGAASASHRKPLSQLDEQEQRLMDLMLSFAHIAQAVEIQGDTEERHAKFRPEMQITRAPADAPPAA